MAESKTDIQKKLPADELKFIEYAIVWLKEQDEQTQMRVVKYLDSRFGQSWSDY